MCHMQTSVAQQETGGTARPISLMISSNTLRTESYVLNNCLLNDVTSSSPAVSTISSNTSPPMHVSAASIILSFILCTQTL